jgi:hypothetical protein
MDCAMVQTASAKVEGWKQLVVNEGGTG